MLPVFMHSCVYTAYPPEGNVYVYVRMLFSTQFTKFPSQIIHESMGKYSANPRSVLKGLQTCLPMRARTGRKEEKCRSQVNPTVNNKFLVLAKTEIHLHAVPYFVSKNQVNQFGFNNFKEKKKFTERYKL